MEQSGRQGSGGVWYTESRLMRRLGSHGRDCSSLFRSRWISFPFLYFQQLLYAYRKKMARRGAHGEATVINKINSIPNTQLATKCRGNRAAQRLVTSRFCLRNRRRLRILTGCVDTREDVVSLRDVCHELVFPVLWLQRKEEEGWKVKRIEQRVFDVVRLWPRKVRAQSLGETSIRIHKNVSRRNETYVETRPVSLFYSLLFRSPPSLSLSLFLSVFLTACSSLLPSDRNENLRPRSLFRKTITQLRLTHFNRITCQIFSFPRETKIRFAMRIVRRTNIWNIFIFIFYQTLNFFRLFS